MKVKLYIESTDMEGEVIKTEHNAMLEEREHDYKLTYVEDISGEGKKTRTTMYICGSSMRIIRDGELVSDFIYANELEHNTSYITPFGEIPVTVITHDYSFVGNHVSYGDDIFSGVTNPLNSGKHFTIDAKADYSLIVHGTDPIIMSVKVRIALR